MTVPNNKPVIQAVAAKSKNVDVVRGKQGANIFLFIKIPIFLKYCFVRLRIITPPSLLNFNFSNRINDELIYIIIECDRKTQTVSHTSRLLYLTSLAYDVGKELTIMELFRIRFINKIRPDTLEIRYRAVLESNSSDTIFEGHQLFLRSYLDPTILKSGEVALKAIYNIFQQPPRICCWIRLLLSNLTIEVFSKCQPKIL